MNIDANPLAIEASEPLGVVTAGAHLLIDVSDNVKTSDVFEARSDVALKYPEGCIEAILIAENKKRYVLTDQSVSWSEGSVLVSLSHDGGLSTELKFTKVIVSSCQPIRKAEITWVNYKH